MTAAAYLVLLERWIAAWIQDRKGPNRVGMPLTKIRVFGLGQPIADGVKFIFKAEYTPAHVDKGLYFLAPMTIFIIGAGRLRGDPLRQRPAAHPLPGKLGQSKQPIKLVIAPGIDVGMIFVFALGSIAVYGVVLGGWASNNKYSFLGGLRSSAQLIAYELPMGLGILGVVLGVGFAATGHDHGAAGREPGRWNAFTQPLGMVVFCVAPLPRPRGSPSTCPRPSRS